MNTRRESIHNDSINSQWQCINAPMCHPKNELCVSFHLTSGKKRNKEEPPYYRVKEKNLLKRGFLCFLIEDTRDSRGLVCIVEFWRVLRSLCLGPLGMVWGECVGSGRPQFSRFFETGKKEREKKGEIDTGYAS